MLSQIVTFCSFFIFFINLIQAKLKPEKNVHVEEAEKITCKLTFDDKPDDPRNNDMPTLSLAFPVSLILNEQQSIIFLANEVIKNYILNKKY
jgi:hypothetical protein